MEQPRENVLITGFGPFPGVPVNASATLARRLVQKARQRLPRHRFIEDILDTEWERAPQRIRDLVRATKPVLALHFGVARDAQGFRIERQAANACRLAEDAAGALPRAVTLAIDGPDLHPVTIDAEAVAAHLSAKNFPVRLSEDAGAYLCNAVLYASLEACARYAPTARAGFIHIPDVFSTSRLDEDRALAGALEILNICLGAPPR